MKQGHRHVLFTACVVMLFLVSNLSFGVIGITRIVQQDSLTKETVMIRCVVGGRLSQKQVSVDSCERMQRLFSAIIEANAVDPCGNNTRMLKVQFIEMLADLGLLSQTCSVEELCSLIDPPWSTTGEAPRWSHLMPPRKSGEDNATLFLCSMAGAGWGFVIPPVLLPRPRLLMQWRGFYPDSSAVSVAEMATGRGVIARGTQIGTAFGFIGVGFAFALPGAPAQFGFLGYSLMTTLRGADMTWYYANFPPLVMEVSPEDGAIEVPVSLSELRFTLKDYDFDKMTYSVVTSPDIGSGSDANVDNGEYSVPVSGLDSDTTYTWTVTVSDGTDTVENTFTFTTEAVAPIVSNPVPSDDEKDVPMDITQLQFTIQDRQGDAMEYTVETSPDIGSQHETGVPDGTYTVPVSGLLYAARYRWYVNVTDGVYWTRKTFEFETGYPTFFDPFEFGWSYRKQMTLNQTLIAGDLTDFPIIVSTVDPDLMKAQTDGDDILFMDGAGVAKKLSHEIEDFDASTGELLAWVKIPSLDADEDTSIYMYYGNPGSGDAQMPTKVWDESFAAVWHLKEAVGAVHDSTARVSGGSISGAQSVPGKIGSALQFLNQGIVKGISNVCDDPISSTFTVSGWVYWYGGQSNMDYIIFDVRDDVYDEAGFVFYISSLHLRMHMNQFPESSILSDMVMPSNIWTFVSMVFDDDADEARVYINENLDSVHTISATYHDSSHSPAIGNNHWAPSDGSWRPVNGVVDELRLAATARSTQWLLTEYNNQNNPSCFVLIGAEETEP